MHILPLQQNARVVSLMLLNMTHVIAVWKEFVVFQMMRPSGGIARHANGIGLTQMCHTPKELATVNGRKHL